jgi:hypothetical protein
VDGRDKAKSDHKHGRRVAPNKRTVADFLTEWMAAIQDSIKPSTHVNYSDYQDAYVLPVIGKKPLQEVDVPLLNGKLSFPAGTLNFESSCGVCDG